MNLKYFNRKIQRPLECKYRFRKIVTCLILQLVSILVFIGIVFWAVPSLKESSILYRVKEQKTGEGRKIAADNITLKVEVSLLQKKINRFIPGGVYLIINTSENTFFLYKNKELIREGICSTGSYVKLEASDTKNWIFETPKGVFTIKGKVTNPVWRKPDWAFVEDGLPVPPPGDPSRYEYGVLGDYALSLGDGYLIHGTLYKRFLGLPVTHGCVRMGDDDLEIVYETLPLGAKVFIF